MYTDEPRLAISRVCDAPRELAFRAFTDPDHLATWWGPSGNSIPRDEIEFDVPPGGFQRWTEISADDVEPFETRFRVDFYDQPHGRTRLEIRQLLHAHLDGPSNQGWLGALEQLDAALLQAAATDVEV